MVRRRRRAVRSRATRSRSTRAATSGSRQPRRRTPSGAAGRTRQRWPTRWGRTRRPSRRRWTRRDRTSSGRSSMTRRRSVVSRGPDRDPRLGPPAALRATCGVDPTAGHVVPRTVDRLGHARGQPVGGRQARTPSRRTMRARSSWVPARERSRPTAPSRSHPPGAACRRRRHEDQGRGERRGRPSDLPDRRKWSRAYRGPGLPGRGGVANASMEFSASELYFVSGDGGRIGNSWQDDDKATSRSLRTIRPSSTTIPSA